MKIETDITAILAEHRKCTNYNLMTDYYHKVDMQEKFYTGNQWYGVNAPDLDKPVLNFIRRVCSFLTAMVTSNEITAFITPYIHTPENSRTADILNIAVVPRKKRSVSRMQKEYNANVIVAGSAVFGANTAENTKAFMEILKSYE